jgi:hypothetical protein
MERQPGKMLVSAPATEPSIQQLTAAIMLPFLQLDIFINNNEGNSKMVPARIQPAEIDYYYPGFHEGTVIVTKSRSSYLTLMAPAEFDQLLQAYHDATASNAGVFGVLTITPKPKLHATS